MTCLLLKVVFSCEMGTKKRPIVINVCFKLDHTHNLKPSFVRWLVVLRTQDFRSHTFTPIGFLATDSTILEREIDGNEICLPTEHLKSAQELVKYVFVHSGSNRNLAVLVFEERGKPEYPRRKISRSKERTTGNRTRTTLVGGRSAVTTAQSQLPNSSFQPKTEIPD